MRIFHASAILLVTLGLQGCAAGLFLKDRIEHFWLARWDAQEAALVTDVVMQSRNLVAICNPKEHTPTQQAAAIEPLTQAAARLVIYSQTLPDDNSPVITVAKNIQTTSEEFYQRAQKGMSRVYCENKAVNVQTQAHQAQQVIQAKRK